MTEEDEYAERDEYAQRVAVQADRFFQEYAMLEEKWEMLKEKEEAGVLTPKQKERMTRIEHRAVECLELGEMLEELDYILRSRRRALIKDVWRRRVEMRLDLLEKWLVILIENLEGEEE